MEQMTKKKRFYKEGEKVWVRELKTTGIVVALQVNPKENIYKVTVETTEKVGKAIVKTVKDYNLWEIDKLKTEQDKKVSEKRPTILFAKVRESAIIPSKNQEDAGYDIYADFEGDFLEIAPQTTVLVPTGIASSVKDDYALIVKERGSTGTKSMAVRSGVVDSSYRGEIFVVINNTGNKKVIIAKENVVVPQADDTIVYPYTKAIAQLLLVQVPKAVVKEISYEELQAIPSKRGTGALGSSNK